MSDDVKEPGGMDRRDAIKALALLPFAAAWDLSAPQLARAATVFTPEFARAAAVPYAPKFFTASEWRTVGLLADYIIPKDERSGSATDARVPEYMDTLLSDKDASAGSKVAMRGGLGWLDFTSLEHFGTTWSKSTDSQRRQILDLIAWPAKAKPEHSHGVAFFNRFRDLTASGFFSSEMGWKDVRYVGNTFNPSWNGCPPAAMAKLGVSHDLMKTRVKPE
jgi:hypothetical protein